MFVEDKASGRGLGGAARQLRAAGQQGFGSEWFVFVEDKESGRGLACTCMSVSVSVCQSACLFFLCGQFS